MRFSIDEAIPVLMRTPATLRAMLEGLSGSWTGPDYGPGTWSAREVLAHLVFNERTDWIPRLRIILAEGDSKPFEPFDRAGHKDLLAQHTADQLLELFAADRQRSIASLRQCRLTEADFARRGMHPALGPVTLSQLLAAWVVHDFNHIAQINKVLAYQYKTEVGPWEQYLSILAPPSPR
ncbi:MAG: DinB family protein [Phycisphaerales bacterium]|nr:DinB family protein [Phycisphaerales bacterium]